MNVAPVQYVKTRDGFNIAYRVSGSGRPLVFVPPPFSHLQVVWLEDYRFAPWLERLSSEFQLVVFDPRGMGMSTRGLPDDHSLVDWQHDIEAVVDHLALDRFVLVGASSSGHVAIHYAIAHPGRLDALVLLTASKAMTAWASALFQVLPAQNWELFLSTLVGKGLSAEDSERAVTRLAEAMTKADWEACARTIYTWNIAEVVDQVQIPTLVLQPRDYVTVRPEEGMELAASIRQAQFTLIEGDTMLGDAQAGVTAIEQFLAGLPAATKTAGLAEVTDDDSSGLSGREKEVLRLLADGKSNQQIADELVISLNTVHRHVSNLFDKTGVANRTQAAAYAKEHGIV